MSLIGLRDRRRAYPNRTTAVKVVEINRIALETRVLLEIDLD